MTLFRYNISPVNWGHFLDNKRKYVVITDPEKNIFGIQHTSGKVLLCIKKIRKKKKISYKLEMNNENKFFTDFNKLIETLFDVRNVEKESKNGRSIYAFIENNLNKEG